jgi:hypothetical protein
MTSRIEKARWSSAYSAYSGARQFVGAVSLDPPGQTFPQFGLVAVRRIAPSGDLGNGKIRAGREGG